jgi:outer membrane lipoprotein-sorting protein
MLSRNFKIIISLSISACLLIANGLCAQTPTKPTVAEGSADEKSQQIMAKATEVLGGSAYLNVKTVVGKGFFTTFREGTTGIPARFLDYIAYPDRERTEFISEGIKTIQTNAGDAGWLYDGGVRKITDQQPAQIEEFKRAFKTSVENLLRGWWRQEGGKVVYVARREAGLAKRNQAIRLTYPDGFWIEYEFGGRDSLPAKIIYKRMRKNLDTGDVEETNEEDQLLKFIAVDGVTAPWVIDHFVNGHQTSRVNYESIQYNQNLPDSLFAKPDDVKKIK